MGDLGAAFSFRDYAQSLAVQAMMAPRDLALAENLILGALAIGALVLFGLMLLRRSGTAAAGFALVALTALFQAILFGRLDFLTPGTELLIGCLTASALLLFVNAVLHTGTENVFIAGLSAVVIGVLTVTGALSASGLDYSAQAQAAIFCACVLSAILLGYAIVRDPGRRGIMGLSAILALIGAILMAPAPTALLDGVFLTVMPALLASGGVLLAALTAPFVGEDVRIQTGRRARDRVPAGVSASLFTDDEEPTRSAPRRALPPRAEDPMERLRAGEDPFTSEVFGENEETGDHGWASLAEPEAPVEARFSAQDPFYTEAKQRSSYQPQEPVSNLWQSGAGAYEPSADDYIWDCFSDQQVRAGGDVLLVFGTRYQEDLDLEGLRGRLAPSALPLFDDEVLGGSDPVSGPFDVRLRTEEKEFRFAGRRQVDHDGILLRIDGTFSDIKAVTTPRETIPFGDHPGHRGQYAGVVRLGDETPIGFEAIPTGSLSDNGEVRALILDAGRHLRDLLEDSPSSGAFALVDASGLKVRPGIVAAAVGKAVRVHELPKGAIVVGLKVKDMKAARDIAPLAEDIRKAGGGVALFLDDKLARGVKFDPDMLWVSASDIDLEAPRKRNMIGQLTKRFGVPILVRDVRDGSDANLAAANGALFGMGRAFAGVAPSVAEKPRSVAPSLDGGFGRNNDKTALSSLTAGGLR
ncbi:MAG: hypothetical protein V2I43_18875 [Parvularcula sp.]|jgi:hypothetical protein|nr:hypothetical protein [Parvularcula sp.]